jgi:hypothetical protein
MDSNTQDSMRVLEAKCELLEAQVAVLRNDLSSLKRQVVRLIVIQNEMQYEQKMGDGIRLRTGNRNSKD